MKLVAYSIGKWQYVGLFNAQRRFIRPFDVSANDAARGIVCIICVALPFLYFCGRGGGARTYAPQRDAPHLLLAVRQPGCLPSRRRP